ncbi:MAG: hypothetical protein GY943_35195 [Chloroflexi bacterium]|nr:hypothetical protein [Chloroflexota bacterium]
MEIAMRVWKRPYAVVMVGCIQFLLLTIIAMLLYPGGVWGNETTVGYNFFQNFFSDLGLITALNGVPNTPSTILFVVALTVAGLSLILFFLTFPRFFTHTPILKWICRLAALVGVWAGVSYIGIAATPADLFLDAHVKFVYHAFVALPISVTLFAIVILFTPSYPNKYAYVMLLFAACLSVYLWLLFFGPSGTTNAGISIQATGQKIIVYLAIISMFIQAYGAFQQSEKVR